MRINHVSILKILKCLIVFLTIFLVICFVFVSLEQNHKIHTSTLRTQSNEASRLPYKFNHSRVDEEGLLERWVDYSLDELDGSTTFVSAYFDLGSFQKGDTGFHTSAMYKKWISIFRRLDSNLIIYLEDASLEAYVKLLRTEMLTKTKIIMVRREDLNSFKYKEEFAEIFKQKGYPQYHPNTVMPDYACAMHAKYELLRRAIVQNPFKSRYFAWLDVGLFREMVEKGNPLTDHESLFSLQLPPQFNSSCISYTQVQARRPHLTTIDIVYANIVWLCGCYFIGSVDILFKWTAEYEEGVRWMMRRRLMSSDQQVIYALHNNHLSSTCLQLYISDGSFNKWFYLAFISRTFQLP